MLSSLCRRGCTIAIVIHYASQGRKISREENLLLSLVSDIVASGSGNSTSKLSEKSISEKMHTEII